MVRKIEDGTENHAGYILIDNANDVVEYAEETEQRRELIDALELAAEKGGIEMGDTPLSPSEEVVFSWALQLGKGIETE